MTTVTYIIISKTLTIANNAHPESSAPASFSFLTSWLLSLFFYPARSRVSFVHSFENTIDVNPSLYCVQPQLCLNLSIFCQQLSNNHLAGSLNEIPYGSWKLWREKWDRTAVSWRPELMVGDAITELFSLIAMKMIRFWNSRGQMMAFNYQNRVGTIIMSQVAR